MLKIYRDRYLRELIENKHNGMIKIITGLRRVGKSYLLNELFYEHLKKEGVLNENIIYLSLDNHDKKQLLDSETLYEFLKARIINEEKHYLLLDEIQLVSGFESVLMSLMQIKNVDIYVTGSNSKFLSNDIVTEFRGRGTVIHVSPLSYSDVHQFYAQNKEIYQELLNTSKWTDFENQVYELYSTYGGLPQVVLEKNIFKKQEKIKNIFNNVYINDVKERYKIEDKKIYFLILQVLANNIGNILNTNKLFNILKAQNIEISYGKLEKYLKYLQDAFLIFEVQRLDYKNKRIMEGKSKIYFSDIGIRNSLIGFLKEDLGLVAENILANELYRINHDLKTIQLDVRVKENDKYITKPYEVDFNFVSGNEKYYIQSCYRIDSEDTYKRETRVLSLIKESFTKIIVSWSTWYSGYSDEGIKIVQMYDILLNPGKYINFY